MTKRLLNNQQRRAWRAQNEIATIATVPAAEQGLSRDLREVGIRQERSAPAVLCY